MFSLRAPRLKGGNPARRPDESLVGISMLKPDVHNTSAMDGLLGRLIGASQTLSSLLSRFAARYQLTEDECFALLTIKHSAAMTGKALGRLCGMHKTKVSRMMRSLEHRGLITCKRDASDLRKVSLNLTPRGTTLASEVALAADELNLQLERTVSQDRDNFYKTLDVLLVKMKAT